MQRQYCGQSGKKANCQVAVTVHYVSPNGHFPAALRLFVPKSWTDTAERLEQAGVPEEYHPERTKGQIALELLDQVRGEKLLPGDVVITDAGHGVSQPFREGLEQRQLFYIAGVTAEMVVFTEEPRWDWPEGNRLEAVPSAGLIWPTTIPTGEPEIAGRMPAAAQGELVREDEGEVVGEIRLGPRLARPGLGPSGCAGAEPIWLLIEERADGKIQYAFSNLRVGTSRIQAVRLWNSRWPVEQGYQQMKEELGLNHFEGRWWRGFHHHTCLVMLAYGFLALEQRREKEAPASPGKKSGLM